MSEQHETKDTLDDVQSSTKGDELKEGTRIDRYQILGLLGKGGMGAVYKAYDPELDRSIAIKILTVKPEEGETASRPQARLMREAQALAKLSHPNVVSVFDVGTFEEGVYIAMEFVKGKTLREWLRGQQLQQKEIIQTLSNAGKGLHAAHTEGIVHRDFKPDNVIIGDRGQVKVLDFGLARAAGTQDTTVPHRIEESVEDSTSGEKLLSKPLTRVGAIIGTTVYMAPEHFQFKELDEKTDQFSFCVTLFEALYGKRPFKGRTSEELEENITSGLIEIPKEVKVPKWIEETILKGLSISKDDRYQSMADLLDALADDPEVAKRKRRKRIQSASVMLIMAAMTIGFGYYAFFNRSEMCTGADLKAAGIWNDERKEKIRQSFANTGLSFAKDSYARVEKLFGEYLSKWSTFYTETCEATRIRSEQSEEVMDRKMGCLGKHLRNADALVKVLGQADKMVVSKSVQAVSSLSGFSNCNDVDALQSRIPPPKDEQTKNKLAAIREKLAEVEAFRNTGKYKEGLELSQALKEKAKAIDYKPLQAEVLYQLGELLDETGNYQEAEVVLHNVARDAGKVGNGLGAARAMTQLVSVVGYRQAQHAAGSLIARDAEVVLDLVGGNNATIRAELFFGRRQCLRPAASRIYAVPTVITHGSPILWTLTAS